MSDLEKFSECDKNIVSNFTEKIAGWPITEGTDVYVAIGLATAGSSSSSLIIIIIAESGWTRSQASHDGLASYARLYTAAWLTLRYSSPAKRFNETWTPLFERSRNNYWHFLIHSSTSTETLTAFVFVTIFVEFHSILLMCLVAFRQLSVNEYDDDETGTWKWRT